MYTQKLAVLDESATCHLFFTNLYTSSGSVGDGDCGTTVKRGALAIQEALQRKEMPLNDAASLCRCLARCVSAMGGTSGAVYNIFFTAAAGRALTLEVL